MKKKVICSIISLLLVLSAIVPAYAEESHPLEYYCENEETVKAIEALKENETLELYITLKYPEAEKLHYSLGGLSGKEFKTKSDELYKMCNSFCEKFIKDHSLKNATVLPFTTVFICKLTSDEIKEMMKDERFERFSLYVEYKIDNDENNEQLSEEEKALRERFKVKFLDGNVTMCMYDSKTDKYYTKHSTSHLVFSPDAPKEEFENEHGWIEWKIPENFYDSQTVMYKDKEYQIYANNKKVGAYIDGKLDEEATKYVKLIWDQVIAFKFASGGFENATRLVFTGPLLGSRVDIEMCGELFPASAGYAPETDDFDISTSWWEGEMEYEMATIVGDATMDGALDMIDVTTTQKSIAKLDTDCNTILADIDENGEVNLEDVTAMQKTIAKL